MIFFRPLTLLVGYFSIAVLAVTIHAYVPEQPWHFPSSSHQPPRKNSDDNKDGNDWMEAEMTVLQFPCQPRPDLTAENVVLGCLRSLQMTTMTPSPERESSSLGRIRPFLTPGCLSILSAGKQTEIGDGSSRNFVMDHPILSLFVGAYRIDAHPQDATYTPAPPAATGVRRGDLASIPVTVRHGPDSAFVHAPSGRFVRPTVSSHPKTSHAVVRLERCRRPPFENCWLVREIINVQYAKGGQGWSRDEGV